MFKLILMYTLIVNGAPLNVVQVSGSFNTHAGCIEYGINELKQVILTKPYVNSTGKVQCEVNE
jgi:hypothetical protein